MSYIYPADKVFFKRGEIRSCHFKPALTKEDSVLPIYLDSMGIRCPQEPVCYSGVSYSFFNFCVEGKGKLYLEGKNYDITPGTGFIVTSDTPVEYFATCDTFTTYWISVNGYLHNEIFEYKNTFFPIYDLNELTEKFYDIITLPLDDRWRIKSSAMVYEYILTLNKQIKNVLNPSDKYTEMLKPVVAYLTYNISQPYNSSILAEMLGVSPTHMCRLFKLAYNCHPCKFAEKIKIDYAKRMLENDTSASISDISHYCGYDNTSYFISLFKKHTGLPPAQYRKILKQEKTL